MGLFRRSVEAAGPAKIEKHIELLDPHGSYRLGNKFYFGGSGVGGWFPGDSDSLFPEEYLFLLDKTIRGPRSKVRTVEDFGHIHYTAERRAIQPTEVLKGGLAYVNAENLSQYVHLSSETGAVFDHGRFCVQAIALAIHREVHGQKGQIDADERYYLAYEEEQEWLSSLGSDVTVGQVDQMLKDRLKDR